MPNPYLSVQSFLALGKETTRGTSQAASIYIPIAPNPTLTPNISWLVDEGLRGSPVQTYNNIPGPRYDSYDFKGNVFADTFPNLVLAIMGGPDSVTTATPHVHTIPLLNSAATGSQPPSYSIYDVDQIVESANACKEVVGAQAVSLDLDFAATGALNYTTKFVGNPFVETTAPTATWSTEVFIPAWSSSITISADTAPVIDGKLTINRKTASIFTLGQQAPFVNFAGPIQATGSFTFLAETTDTTMTDGLTYDKQTVTLSFTDPVSSHIVAWTMSQVQFKEPKVDRGKDYVTITTNFEAESDPTDAASGFAPMKWTITNSQSTAY